MAQTLISLTFEQEPFLDAGHELSRAMDAVRPRHGDAFRALERRIEAAFDPIPAPQFRTLESGRFVLMPPQIWIDLLADCRRMGVI